MYPVCLYNNRLSIYCSHVVAIEIISMYTIYMDIPQGPQPIGHLVWRLSMRFRNAVDVAVSPFGLTHAQYVVLASLRSITFTGRTPTQRELADYTALDPIYISKLVRMLQRSGLVARTADKKDTRAVRLGITDKGQHLADQAIPVVHNLTSQFMAPLGGPDSNRARIFARDLEALLSKSPDNNKRSKKEHTL
jgi:MarR family transcriptional regulator, organic hydroperoxide resistance regulator